MQAGMQRWIAVLLILALCIGMTGWAEETDVAPAPEGVSGDATTPLVPPAPEGATENATTPLVAPVPEGVSEDVVTPPVTDGDAESEAKEAQALKEQQEKEQMEKAAQFCEALDAMVRKRIDSYYKAGGKGTIGIYIKELGTGFAYGYNEGKTESSASAEGYFKAASTCKLLSAAVMYYLNNKDELVLDQSYTDKISKVKYNLKTLLYRMVSHSVNEYFNITLRHLGGKKINEVLKELGTANSFVYSEIGPAPYTSSKANMQRYGIARAPRTTPRDLGHILELVYGGETFGAENHKRFADSLKANIYSNRLPMGIGYRSPVGHKTGTSANEGVYNDAGIVYLEGNPYIMVVMSRDSGSGVQAMYRSLARDIYDYMKGRIRQDQGNAP